MAAPPTHASRSLWSGLVQLPPLAKITLWLSAVAVIAACLQALAWSAGLPFYILDKSGGSVVLISLALFLLLVLIAVDRRPMADYGLVADERWVRHGFGGLAIGVLVYGGYCAACVAAGVFFLRPESVTAYRAAGAALAGLSALPIAVTQQIIFGGYLLSTLRTHHGRLLAVLLPAALFAAACSLPRLGTDTPQEVQRLAIGMFLVAALTGALRLRTGNIALAAGVLAGCICVRKIVAKTRLLGFDSTAPLAVWLAPEGDPRQGVGLWLILAVAIAATAVVIRRLGERVVDRNASLEASFKRVMPFSNLLALAPLDHWLALLWAARLRVGWQYLPRLAVTLIASTVNTLLSLPERLLAPLLIRHQVPPPVFIVGMPRSGTTHLHNLLALDPQFRSPRNYEVFNPYGFLTGWLTTAAMAPFLTWRRPMDAVQMQVASPQEEEFALAGMGCASPYWAFGFPRLVGRYDRYWDADGFSPRELARWQRCYRLFLRKQTAFRRRRRPLLKNPANTGRVRLLKEMHPGAKFIHIHRHPYAVYRSNVHLANEGLVVFQLQDADPLDSYATRILPNYRRLMDAFYRDTADLEPEDVADVRFEDLETDPLRQIERIYKSLDLSLTDDVRSRVTSYLDRISGYRKNLFATLPETERERIDAAMAPYFGRWGYTPEGLANAEDRHAA